MPFMLRVVDTEQALCVVTKIPGGHAMVYDTGTAGACFKGVTAMLPEGSTIDLLVQSHGDSDHIGAKEKILKAYDVRRVLRTGQGRDSATWCRADIAVAEEMTNIELGPTERAQALEHHQEYAERVPWLATRYG
jgi:beta-lactamase superfamily II metal-dependent hydrolase